MISISTIVSSCMKTILQRRDKQCMKQDGFQTLNSPFFQVIMQGTRHLDFGGDLVIMHRSVSACHVPVDIGRGMGLLVTFPPPTGEPFRVLPVSGPVREQEVC